MRNSSLWSAIVFEKQVFSHEFDFETSDLEIKHLNAHNFVWQGCLTFSSFIIISQVWWPIELKCSQVCYFMHFYVQINQLWRLIFDNYRYCPLPLFVNSPFVFSYNEMVCKPCGAGCDTCVDGRSCRFPHNWTVRMVLLILQCITMGCTLPLFIFTIYNRDVKVKQIVIYVDKYSLCVGLECPVCHMYKQSNN